MSLPTKEILAIGPSLVDVNALMPDTAYLECCDLVDASPGDWRRISDPETADRLFSQVTGQRIGSIATGQELICPNGTMTISAGSTGLGMLSAMSADSRARAAYLSTVGFSGDKQDPMSGIFSASLRNGGILHLPQRAEGFNPLGFVLSGSNIAEKLLCMHPGVANELTDKAKIAEINPTFVIVDSYELQEGPIAEMLKDLIESGRYNIGLSLGNHSIIHGKVREVIRYFIKTKKLAALCGNKQEFEALYPELDADASTKQAFGEHPVHSTVDHVLMTYGPYGVIARSKCEIAEEKAFPVDPSKICNTSGAGDVTAGAFYEGILTGEDLSETLKNATRLASQVLQLPGSNGVNVNGKLI